MIVASAPVQALALTPHLKGVQLPCTRTELTVYGETLSDARFTSVDRFVSGPLAVGLSLLSPSRRTARRVSKARTATPPRRVVHRKTSCERRVPRSPEVSPR